MFRALLLSSGDLPLTAGAALAEFTLHILHTNDFDSRVEPMNRLDSTCEAETLATSASAGTPRLAAAIAQLRDGAAVLDAGGERIGIIGITTTHTPEIASPRPSVAFIDEASALAGQAGELSTQGVDKIIALTHVGYAPEFAARIDGRISVR